MTGTDGYESGRATTTRRAPWRLTDGMTARSRRRKFGVFMDILAPGACDRVLDVGVCDRLERSSNFLEAWYPWPAQITAVGLDEYRTFEEAFPQVRLVRADGRRLPFRDQEFDIGFSNAVIEHVGSREEQAAFASEIVRVCRRAFLTSPNRHFPVDPHTLLPFIHWLPISMRARLYTRLGQKAWAKEENLNPLSKADLEACFSVPVDIIRQRVLGLTANLIAVVNHPVGGSE